MKRRALIMSLLVGSLASFARRADAPGYQTVQPKAGDPFQPRDEFTTLEPARAGTRGKPPLGWVGTGHIILQES